MTLGLFCSNSQTTPRVKDLIFQVLSQDFPLSTSQIVNRLRGRHSLSVSFQAVHKAVGELASQGVVVKTKLGWKLSTVWISKVKSFVNGLELKYADQDSIVDKVLKMGNAGSHMAVAVFKTIKEFDHFLLTIMTKEDSFYSFVEHPWFPVIHTERILEYSDTPKSKKVVICSDETKVDKYCIRFLKKMGETVGIGDSFDSNFSFSIYGDHVVMAFFESELMNYLKKMYRKASNFAQLDQIDFNRNFVEKETEIIAIITYNPILADSLRKRLDQYFKT